MHRGILLLFNKGLFKIEQGGRLARPKIAFADVSGSR
jgi:hypothetical protein